MDSLVGLGQGVASTEAAQVSQAGRRRWGLHTEQHFNSSNSNGSSSGGLAEEEQKRP